MGLDHGHRRDHRCRRHRRVGSAGAKSREGNEEGQEFHEAGVRWKVWRYRGGSQADSTTHVKRATLTSPDNSLSGGADYTALIKRRQR